MVSIPGFPLGTVPKESAENGIKFYELTVSGLRIFGETTPLARVIGYLAGLYAAVGDFTKADRLYDEAKRILQEKGDSKDLGWVHNNQGLAWLDQERYAEASGAFRAGVSVLRPDDAEALEPRAITLQNLASVDQFLGDVEESESAYLEALSILRRLGEERDRTYQVTSQNLALLYSSIGDFGPARKIHEDLLAQGGIRDSSLQFAILNDLGLELRDLEEFAVAEARLREAQTLTAEGSRERALVLTNLAVTHRASGNLDKAEQEGEQALRLVEQLHEPGSTSAAAVEATLGSIALARGDLGRAERLLTRAKTTLSRQRAGELGVLAELNRALALVAHRQGRRERALGLSREALDLEGRSLDQILSFGSEAQRLAYHSNAFPYDFLANMGEATQLAEAVLRRKGAVLDSLLVERALVRKSRNPADHERLDRIHTLKIAAMEQVARGEDGRLLDELERSLKKEETALATRLARPFPEQSRADLTKVRAALESGQVLIELVRFQLIESGGKLVPHYGAVLVPNQDLPTWVPLGKAVDLEGEIERLAKRMEHSGRGVELLSSKGAPEGDVTMELRGLYEALWKPLAALLPAGTKKVLLSPDGALQIVPWAALLDENQAFVAERWQIAQVSSGRDLLRKASGSADKTLLALAEGESDLPYTTTEVQSLDRIAHEQGWRTEVFTGDKASEIELFKHHSPGILHLATHGGQLSGDWEGLIGARLSKRPMYRGFVILGGAGKTLEAWKRGTVFPFSEDGILTAEEVGGLDLSRTWLTVLSACQTGAGEVRSGEGVLGLRRGFALAGTQYLLFTLWSVEDEATARFMENFYRQLFQTLDPVRAFQETQAAELVRLKQLEGIRRAAVHVGGFVLTR
ncbi:MAG TPA: CHAT domain-containing tetratricopeptide repeat protein [Thermoanaerobaculia bacterium]|nr:CHAT domain-containing tetratricopeptide repeat protein [Thermoanaerobaculia bacterium]